MIVAATQIMVSSVRSLAIKRIETGLRTDVPLRGHDRSVRSLAIKRIETCARSPGPSCLLDWFRTKSRDQANRNDTIFAETPNHQIGSVRSLAIKRIETKRQLYH